ncbi:MAG: hypothetical protein LBD14_04935 [Puniceicoccales bacterium]|jgi:hypothetical protein|nr:hypothetical protein [Puniceicoccales bacterium]
MNWYLFEMMRTTLKLPFPHHRLLGTTSDGYLYKILEYDVDYAINIDEDAFVIDNGSILKLLAHCIRENVVSCGIRDGGEIPHRSINPIVMNPFFSIMDVRTIRGKFSNEKIRHYAPGVSIDYEKFLPKDLPHKYSTERRYEPYESFYLWLNTNFKTEYLSGDTHEDGITTTLKNHLGEPMLHHTWFSRKFGKDKFHTDRIKNIFDACDTTGLKFTVFDRMRAAVDFLAVKIAKRRRDLLSLFSKS